MPLRFVSFTAAAVLMASLATSQTAAQCAYTTTLVSSWDRMDPSTPGGAQNTANVWRFERTDMNGAFLTGINNGGHPAWGSPDQSYSVPLVGPRYSPDPNRNQISFYYRTPSFEGLMQHPGTGDIGCVIEFRPQSEVSFTGLTLSAEDLGQASPNVLIRAEIDDAGGSTILIPDTSVNSLAAALTLTPGSGLPRTLGPGVVLRVISTNGGSPSEDWLNTQIVLNLQGPPVIIQQPDSTHLEGLGDVNLTVAADGATVFHWYRGTTLLSDGITVSGATISGSSSAKLTIANAQPGDSDSYHVEVGNSCGKVASSSASVTICAADFNGDGFADIFDFNDYVTCFEGGACPPGRSADYDGDGFVDIFDFFAFTTAFEQGC